MALVKVLEEVMMSGYASKVLVALLAVDQHLRDKHEGCIVRSKLCAMGQKGTNVTGRARVEESQRGNTSTIQSLTDQYSCSVNKPEEMCEVFPRILHSAVRDGRRTRKEGRYRKLTYLPIHCISQAGKQSVVKDRLHLRRWRRRSLVGTSCLDSMVFPMNSILAY